MNEVLWSLQAEMVGSLLIFFVWLLTRDDPLKLIIALRVVAAAVPLFRGNHFVVYLPAVSARRADPSCPARISRSRAAVRRLALLLLPNIVFGYRGVARVFEIVAAIAIIGCVAAQRPVMLKRRRSASSAR